MRTLHLFAGAGGGILADLILGHTPVCAVEWDPYACAVLRERFPGLSVIEGDVREVDFSRMAGIDAICGGFPCQDISAAGKGAGITGERSGLYREVMRAVDAIRPQWVFIENSPLIRTRGRHIVIGDLVARGYSWRDGILSAADVGAPHKRARWWCLATLSDARHRAECDRPRDTRGQTWERSAEWLLAGSNGEAQPVAHTTGERLEVAQSSEAGHQQPPAAGDDRSLGWWSTEPGMGRVAHGVAHRPHRIKCLGNGQVPLCAAVAWKLLGGP